MDILTTLFNMRYDVLYNITLLSTEIVYTHKHFLLTQLQQFLQIPLVFVLIEEKINQLDLLT